MRLVTFTHDTLTRVGELDDGLVYGVTWADPMRELIRRGLTPNRNGQRYALAEIELEPVLRPGKIIAIGRNYAEHAEELGNKLPQAPLIFAIFPSAVIGPGAVITWRSSITQNVDWEAELAVVIGKRAREVSEQHAYKHVFGYTVANDVTARDLQKRIDSQWTRGKSLETFCPLGPAIVTRDEIPDPHNLDIKTCVNGAAMQDSNTRHMIFDIPYLVSYCSWMFTLEPGDVILTGTPSGVGEGRTPPQYLQDGDEVTVAIEAIGELTNTCRVLD